MSKNHFHLAAVFSCGIVLSFVQVALSNHYQSIGCYQDRGDRAIPTLEGQDPTLDGNYWTRQNPVAKCYAAAKRRGFQVFAVQNGGWCASGPTAAKTFNKYGPSSACRSDGEGGPWGNQVYYITDYENVGCYRDTSNRTIQSLEGRDSVLDGHYLDRRNPILKCALAAKRAGYNMFAVQNGGWCASSRLAVETFNKYGPSSACWSDGEGGPWANQVYYIKDHENVGCYRDTSNRTIQSLEGRDSVLDGHYLNRRNPILKCALAAKRAGYNMFAVQNGGWCASSSTVAKTFNKYGGSSACRSDGGGGPWANQVYYIKDHESVGCYRDTSDRAIQPLEGRDSVLDVEYWYRRNPTSKCAVAAMSAGYSMFAVQNGGWCASSSLAAKTFSKYGRSSDCRPDGEGGPRANQVYYIKGYRSIGCYRDTAFRAIQTLEGTDSILDGLYSHRRNPIAKCAVAAMKAGYRMFAVQNGGWCASSAAAPKTFAKYGNSTACKQDGEGGPWANQVYSFIELT
ncbi:uncharacterized protein LOC111333443 [Stylophora pistillata]|uniref:uncharacterized protein LOC111333443 n=1 Tax=Stylophora pistillata TaxID=50429 RepID=UPI000C041758|nr:uncharacterized protein LOC111333443 [Stylophora pistillata]